MRNKIINTILFGAGLASATLVILMYLYKNELNLGGILTSVSCFVAIYKKGNAKPSYEIYKKQYECLQSDVFENRNYRKLIRDSLYWYNKKNYKRASLTIEKLKKYDELSYQEIKVIQYIDEIYASYKNKENRTDKFKKKRE